MGLRLQLLTGLAVDLVSKHVDVYMSNNSNSNNNNNIYIYIYNYIYIYTIGILLGYFMRFTTNTTYVALSVQWVTIIDACTL